MYHDLNSSLKRHPIHNTDLHWWADHQSAQMIQKHAHEHQYSNMNLQWRSRVYINIHVHLNVCIYKNTIMIIYPFQYPLHMKPHQAHTCKHLLSLASPWVGLGCPDPQLIQESKFDRNNGLVVMHQLQTGSKSSSRDFPLPHGTGIFTYMNGWFFWYR